LVNNYKQALGILGAEAAFVNQMCDQGSAGSEWWAYYTGAYNTV
jgi:hypothetical protein